LGGCHAVDAPEGRILAKIAEFLVKMSVGYGGERYHICCGRFESSGKQ
jgi:hypothetical protein